MRVNTLHARYRPGHVRLFSPALPNTFFSLLVIFVPFQIEVEATI